MPIKGLTDKPAALPQIGILRKGGKKTDPKKPGPDLDYFRFVADDPATEAAFYAEYGEKPRQVNVFLPFDTVDENFEAWKEHWKASALQHRCDGETCVLWLQEDGTYSQKPKPCPGGCKQVGRLKIVIPELGRLASVCALTTGIWDVMNLHSSLMALDQYKVGQTLRGIPLVLRRVEREISTPRGNGQRARTKKWLLQIEAAPKWVALQLKAQERAALPGQDIKQLALNAAPEEIEAEDDSEEIGADVPVAGVTDSSISIIPPHDDDDDEEEPPQTAAQGPAIPAEEERLNAALLHRCKKEKGDKNGPAFFQAKYGKLGFEQKQAEALRLGLIVAPAAEPEAIDAEIIEEPPKEKSRRALLSEIIAELQARGISEKEIKDQVYELCDGQTNVALVGDFEVEGLIAEFSKMIDKMQAAKEAAR